MVFYAVFTNEIYPSIFVLNRLTELRKGNLSLYSSLKYYKLSSVSYITFLFFIRVFLQIVCFELFMKWMNVYSTHQHCIYVQYWIETDCLIGPRISSLLIGLHVYSQNIGLHVYTVSTLVCTQSRTYIRGTYPSLCMKCVQFSLPSWFWSFEWSVCHLHRREV